MQRPMVTKGSVGYLGEGHQEGVVASVDSDVPGKSIRLCLSRLLTLGKAASIRKSKSNCYHIIYTYITPIKIQM